MKSNISKKFYPIFYPLVSCICISALVGCSSPRYAPVTSRAPAKSINKIPNAMVYNNSDIYNNPAPPAYNPNVNAIPSTNISTQNISNEPTPNGYYRVMPGDTLYKIARENNIAPKDLIAWNAMDNPNNIQPYQLIRVSSSTGVSGINNIKVNPPAISNTNSISPNSSSSTYTTSSSSTNFMWPVKIPKVIKKFDGKGIDFSGKLGDPVSAVGDGTVIYANSMRGYGNLVILGHGNDIVTAYAHLQQIIVKEQQKIKKGQMIGTIGNTQSEQVKLHFEVRKKSEAVDPIPYLK